MDRCSYDICVDIFKLILPAVQLEGTTEDIERQVERAWTAAKAAARLLEREAAGAAS